MQSRHLSEGSRFGARLIGAWAGLFWFAASAAASSVPSETPLSGPEARRKQIEDWRIACATGDGAACHALGEAYETRKDLWGRQIKGDGVHRSDEQALRHFRMACDHGYAEGCSNLGRLYETGKGAAKDDAEADSAYAKACALLGGDACANVEIAPGTAPAAPKLRS